MDLLARAAALVSAATIMLAGCGGPGLPATVPVTGTVTLDGTPVEGAAVNFQPTTPGPPARGLTDSSGQFTLSTFRGPDGAVPGTYQVAVSKIEAKQGGAGGTQSGDSLLSGPADSSGPPKRLLPAKYVNPSRSGITIEVKPDMEPVKIELTSK